jgi:hypothetical protein
MEPINRRDFTEAEDLLSSLAYGMRKFNFAGTWTEFMLGVMLEETADSFLVAMPARITVQNGVSLMDAVADGPFIRCLKTDFRAVTFVGGLHKKMYIEYLMAKTPSVFPELLDMIGITVVCQQPNDQETPFDGDDDDDFSPEEESPFDGDDDDDVSPKVAPVQIVDSSIDHVEGVLVQPKNISDSDLREIVEKALAGGFFMPSNSKVPS